MDINPHLSYSTDSVAASEHSQVTLIRFNPLFGSSSAKQQQEEHAKNSQISTISNPGRYSSNLSALPLSNSINAKQNQKLQLEQQQHDDGSQFQIVWRRLAFEVNTNSYDRVITDTLGKLSSIIGGRKKLEEKAHRRHQNGASSKRLIFENLNGRIRSGQITAIMGPSGAGKTSLLNALCGRTDNYRGSIQLLASDGSQQAADKRLRSTIIPQKDYLIEQLTVRESLLYASRILNPGESFDHLANIVRVVEMLNLSACFDSSISNISGGEYKRVSIAQELLSQPDILILDEPTSGLDSLNCKNLIRCLAELTRASRKRRNMNPMAVVLTIHQPDIEVFNMFDHVYCMARAGKVIYDGDPKKTIQVVKACFAQLGDQTEKAPPGIGDDEDSQQALFMTNPANLLIEIASNEYGPKPIESLAKLQLEQFKSSPMEQQQLQLDSTPNQDDGNSNHLSIPISSSSSKVSQLTKDKRLSATTTSGANTENLFFYHTKLLTKRAFLSTIRDPMMTLASLLFHLLIPFVMYTVYPHNIGTISGCPIIVRDIETLALASNQTLGLVEDLQEQLIVAYECAIMFFVTIYSFSMCSIALAALAFPTNMHVLLKEARNGWYGLNSFVIAKSVASFPFEVLFPAMSIAMIYALLDMPDSYLQWRLWTIALVAVIVSMISQTLGLIFGASFMDSVQTAVFLGLTSTIPQVLLSGFVTPVMHMPKFLRFMSFFIPYRYSSDMINMVRFGFGMCPCDDSTEAYLREKQPEFSDVPESISRLFSLYVREELSMDEFEKDPQTGGGALTTTESSMISKLNATYERVPGIYYDLKLNSSTRTGVLNELDSGGADLYKQLAEQVARSFSYGHPIDGCDSIRAEILNSYDTPRDDELAKMFTYLILLLLGVRILLFLIVKFQIGSKL